MRCFFVRLAIFLAAAAVNQGLKAQFILLSQGSGYNESVYFDLATQSSTSVPLDAWDIAFGVNGNSWAVFINEGVGSSRGVPSSSVSLYASTAIDFVGADTSTITEELFNPNLSWQHGAFNTPANSTDPFDLGWGSYSPSDQSVQGSRVFFIKLRDGSMRKMKINSLAGGVYSFSYADLDGENEQTVTIDKSAFSGQTLAYYTFDEPAAKSLEPVHWDLLFTRYSTKLFDGSDSLQYIVTGILQNREVSVAELNGVDPAIEPVPLAGFSTELTTIGHDWKTFNFNSSAFELPEDRVYFVNNSDSIYRIKFIDFEGSSTGNVVFHLTAESPVSSARSAERIPSRIYPNPSRVDENVQLEFDLGISSRNAQLLVFDVQGRLLLDQIVDVQQGANLIEVPISQLPKGSFFLRVANADFSITQALLRK